MSPNWSSRRFSKSTKNLAWNRCKDGDGAPRCEGCTKAVTRETSCFDHTIPWELCRYSGPSNCQVLCDDGQQSCNWIKTYTIDIPLIADNNRLRDRHQNGRKISRRPLPCGRVTRWTKPMRGAPVLRMSLAEKHRATMAARAILTEQAEA